MSAALVIGARNLGFAIIERLLADGWDVAGGAVSAETLDRIRGAGAHPVEMDVTDQASVLAALEEVGARFEGSTWSSMPPLPTPPAAGARSGAGPWRTAIRTASSAGRPRRPAGRTPP